MEFSQANGNFIRIKYRRYCFYYKVGGVNYLTSCKDHSKDEGLSDWQLKGYKTKLSVLITTN